MCFRTSWTGFVWNGSSFFLAFGFSACSVLVNLAAMCALNWAAVGLSGSFCGMGKVLKCVFDNMLDGVNLPAITEHLVGLGIGNYLLSVFIKKEVVTDALQAATFDRS